MSDTQTLKQMLGGLQQKLLSLRDDEKIFLKVSGLNEEITKASIEKEGYQDEITKSKKRRDDGKARKAVSIAETTSKIEQKINNVLPFGQAVFTYEDEEGKRSMKIGWKHDDVVTPYYGLSGMEKQVFDAALAHLLDADIIVVEAAESDPDNLIKILEELAKLDKQVVVNTWFPVDSELAPEPFKVIEV